MSAPKRVPTAAARLLLPCRAALACVPLLLLPAGCHSAGTPHQAATLSPRQLQQQQARALAKSEAVARETLDQIPPPSKRRYINVHSTDAWVNPFLSVHRDSVTLRVIFPQTTGSPVDGGTMLHPAAARKQELEVRFADLPEALSAVPDFSWPYGRVVAVEESPTAPRQDRAQIRRNVESIIQMLNNLDLVVDEWSSPTGKGLLH
ncbi:MAG: hypothetical protein ACR2JE_09040 [Acidobacteriaceae bacterium]